MIEVVNIENEIFEFIVYGGNVRLFVYEVLEVVEDYDFNRVDEFLKQF